MFPFRIGACQVALIFATLPIIAIAGMLPFLLARCPVVISRGPVDDPTLYTDLSQEERERKPKLQINKTTGKFKIVIFSDQHYGENAWDSWGPEQDRKSDTVSSRVLDYEKPDFVVFNGDQVTANNIMTHNATLYWDQATAPASARGIPWAAVPGNHDDMQFVWTDFDNNPFGPDGIPQPYYPPQGRRHTSRQDLLRYDALKPLSLSQVGPAHLWPSAGNYYVPILSQDGEGLAAILYFLDSGGGSFPEVISAAQGQWLKQTASEINPLQSVPELVFWHIPSAAFLAAGPPGGALPVARPCFGSLNDELPSVQDARFAWGRKDGIMGFLESRESVKAIFCGHNHGAEWCCPSPRSTHMLWLCQVRHSGYGGYTTTNDLLRGAKVVQIQESPFRVGIWVRLEDGSVPKTSTGDISVG